MKQYFSFLMLLSFLLVVNACKDDENDVALSVDVDMSVKALYDDEPLVMAQSYTYVTEAPIFFTKLRLYLSHIVLTTADGSEVELSEVEVLDFSSIMDRTAAEQGLQLSFPAIPEGEYTGISFGVGVSRDLNATTPSDYSSSHPLAESGDYWNAWESYIFTKIEGKVDLEQNGSFGLGVVYHIGSDDLYRTITFNKAISVDKDNTTLPSMSLDLKKVLSPSLTDYLDIEHHSSVHNDIDLMNYIMDNFDTAIELN